ncbi:MAG: SufD family Fe-S cluster assembly protein [Bacilli bacterium]|nr:SufD family Fe-S cluster assembly protein [Bacilli bacterium]
MIVFDPKSDGIASPALVIDDNDVSASHAAVVGRLNEEHLYYLQSRGVSLEEAKRLIASGYLRPIEAGFADENVKNRIDSIIEGGF